MRKEREKIMKMIPLNKQSKKAQKEFYKEQRGSWNGVNPVSRIVPNGKGYDRNRWKKSGAEED